MGRITISIAQRCNAASPLLTVWRRAVEKNLAAVRANMRADFVMRFPTGIDWDALLDRFTQTVRQRKAFLERQTMQGSNGPH
jgi:hypothetical protein